MRSMILVSLVRGFSSAKNGDSFILISGSNLIGFYEVHQESRFLMAQKQNEIT